MLLRGKLFPPRTDDAIERPRLLTAATRPSRRITLLTAGPGMGKTWLAASIVRASERVAWVSFESADAEGCAAWSYIVESLAPFLGTDVEEVRGLLTQSRQEEAVDVLTHVTSTVVENAQDIFLVLDDAHVLFGTETWSTILHWMRGASKTFRFVITARQEPADYLGDLALHGELTHIDHEGFRLTPEESRTVLRGFEGLVVSAEREERLIRQADGWIGALQMLAAAERIAPGGAMEKKRAATTYLWQFLAREVVDSLEATEQDVLVVAAALPDCRTTVLQECFPDARMPELLDELQRRVPFLGRLRSGDETRRIHPLLRAFLRERHDASPDRWAPALLRARQVYEEEGESAAALEVALLLREETAIIRLAKVVSTSVVGPHYLLRLPRALAAAEPEIAMQLAFVHLARNELDECRFLSDNFPPNAPSELVETMRFLSLMLPTSPTDTESQVLLLPRFAAPIAERPARRVVSDAARFIMLLRQAMELNGRRRPDPALRSVESIKSMADWDSTEIAAIFTLITEAQIREERGELERCLRLYDDLGRRVDRSPELAHLAAYVHLGRAGVFMKRFRLDDAAAAIDRGRPLVAGQPATIDAGYVINEIELLLCTGDMAAGLALLRPICRAPRLHYGSAHYLLDLDRLGGADEEAKESYRTLCERQGFGELTSEELMLYARFSPEDPRSTDRLDDALARMRADGYVSRLMDTLLLKAARSREDIGSALDSLREAVHYGVPEEFLMPFVVENELPTSLLHEAIADERHVWGPRERSFLERVIELRKIRSAPAVAPSQDAGLSDREREVLRELAKGKSNAQIAQSLFVSLPTVKTHVASILAKLGAARRTEAVEVARKRGILTYPES